jgi:hypothetical protein
MSGMIYTTSSKDGFRVGQAVKTYEGPFNTAIILGFQSWDGEKTWEAVLFRPMAYAHDYGTRTASPLMGSEQYACSTRGLKLVADNERYPFRIGEMATLSKLSRIKDVMYPRNDPDYQWDADTMDAIASIVQERDES